MSEEIIIKRFPVTIKGNLKERFSTLVGVVSDRYYEGLKKIYGKVTLHTYINNFENFIHNLISNVYCGLTDITVEEFTQLVNEYKHEEKLGKDFGMMIAAKLQYNWGLSLAANKDDEFLKWKAIELEQYLFIPGDRFFTNEPKFILYYFLTTMNLIHKDKFEESKKELIKFFTYIHNTNERIEKNKEKGNLSLVK